MRNKSSGRSRGFGFIIIQSPINGAEPLCQYELDFRQIEVKSAVPKEEMGAKTKKIFVGGLPIQLNQAMFQHHFARYGPIVEAQIMKDRKNSRSRGFGFIRFQSEDSVEAVLRDEHLILGKQVEVKKALPKHALEIGQGDDPSDDYEPPVEVPRARHSSSTRVTTHNNFHHPPQVEQQKYQEPVVQKESASPKKPVYHHHQNHTVPQAAQPQYPPHQPVPQAGPSHLHGDPMTALHHSFGHMMIDTSRAPHSYPPGSEVIRSSYSMPTVYQPFRSPITRPQTSLPNPNYSGHYHQDMPMNPMPTNSNVLINLTHPKREAKSLPYHHHHHHDISSDKGLMRDHRGLSQPKGRDIDDRGTLIPLPEDTILHPTPQTEQRGMSAKRSLFTTEDEKVDSEPFQPSREESESLLFQSGSLFSSSVDSLFPPLTTKSRSFREKGVLSFDFNSPKPAKNVRGCSGDLNKTF